MWWIWLLLIFCNQPGIWIEVGNGESYFSQTHIQRTIQTTKVETPRIPRKEVYSIRPLINNPPCPPGERCQ
jgi:hypothetical protein